MSQTHASRALTRPDLEHLLYGLGFAGSGGGGGFQLARALVEAIVEDIPPERWLLHEVGSARDDDFAVMAGGIGAPSAVGPDQLREFIGYVRLAIRSYAQSEEVAISALVPVEAGPVNALLALYLGWSLGLRVFDCDGAGRAVPSLTNLVYGYNGYPIAPLWLAGKVQGSPSALRVSPAPASAAEAEGAIRDNLGRFGFAAGLVCWGQTGQQLRASRYLLPGTLGRLIGLGAGAAATGFTREALLAFLGQRPEVLAALPGVVTDLQQRGQSGHDGGVLHIAGDDGRAYQLHYLNENMLLTRGPEVVATAPSTITALFRPRGSERYLPLNHGDDLPGQAVLGHPVILGVLRESRLLFESDLAASFRAVLRCRHLGYEGPFVPAA